VFVPFDYEHRRFSEPELSDGLSKHDLSSTDLLFIDSPAGTRNQQNVLPQLLTWVKPRFVIYHDSLRDSANLFRDQARHGLRLIDFFDSPRGLTLFALPPHEEPETPLDSFDAATTVSELRVSITFLEPSAPMFEPGGQTSVRIALANRSGATLSSRYTRPVHISYHWWTRAGEMAVWDGVRTKLPSDLEPGDTVECLLDVVAPEQEGEYLLQVAVVQEGVVWFETIESKSTTELIVRSRASRRSQEILECSGLTEEGRSGHPAEKPLALPARTRA
jgi:hypothetical protein